MVNKQFKLQDKILTRSRSPVFELIQNLHVNTWFKFEGKIQNASKVIAFTRNHTDNEDNGTRSGGDIMQCFRLDFSY